MFFLIRYFAIDVNPLQNREEGTLEKDNVSDGDQTYALSSHER